MIDWTKPIQTKDGKKARLLGEINHPRFPMVVAIWWDDEQELVDTYKKDSTVLINTPSEIEMVVELVRNRHNNDVFCSTKTKYPPEYYDILASKRVKFIEGEFEE